MTNDKPHLFVQAGEWCCLAQASPDDWSSPIGFGDSPAAAYAEWKLLYDGWKIFKQNS